MSKKHLIRQIVIILFVITLCTIASFLFPQFNIRTENIIMIYLVGVMFIIIETKRLVWALTSSLISVLAFNYFFTEPTFSLKIYDSNYIITIIIFLIVTLIASTLVNKLQQHTKIAKENEQRTNALYEITRSYLNLSDIEQILHHHIMTLYEYQQITSVVFYRRNANGKLRLYKNAEVPILEAPDEYIANLCVTHGNACGYGTDYLTETKWSYHPLRTHDDLLGVYAIYHDEHVGEQHFINTLVSLMIISLEREQLFEQQEKNRIEIEKEKLRNHLLRSISHDLRTPLTGIAGSSSLIVENYAYLDDDTILNLVRNMASDAVWLNQLVENLLNMTRIQDGKLLISKQKEVVDDIIAEAIRRCELRKGNHIITAHLPQDVVLVSMDGHLIVQVLLNFIDNAIKHTPDDAHIDIYFYMQKNKVSFEVIDDGEGFDPSIEDKLFDSFVTTKSDRSDAKRGVGLGLSICKAIIEAHSGHIYAKNKEDGHGAIFGFTLPYTQEERV